MEMSMSDLCREQAVRIAELEALLREIDAKVIFETAVHDGNDLQERVEAALGIGTRPSAPGNRQAELEAVLRRIVDHYGARSELHTSDADTAVTMADIARAAIERQDGECAPEVATDMSQSARIADLEAACRVALTAYSRVSRVRVPGDIAGDLTHARETLRRALGEQQE